MTKNIFILLLLISFKIKAQTKVYTVDKEEIITETELDKRLDKMEKLINRTSKKTKFVNPTILDSTITNDTITYYVKFFVEEKKKNLAIKEQALASYINKKLLQFELENLNGKKVTLEDFNDKPTFINFWFTNCPPCIKELPLLQSLQKEYKNDFNFVAITFDSKEKVLRFLEHREFDFNHLINARKYIDELGISMYPVSIYLDKQGIVRYSDESYKIDNTKDLEIIKNKIINKLSSLN